MATDVRPTKRYRRFLQLILESNWYHRQPMQKRTLREYQLDELRLEK
jgi:hypothetical protein